MSSGAGRRAHVAAVRAGAGMPAGWRAGFLLRRGRRGIRVVCGARSAPSGGGKGGKGGAGETGKPRALGGFPVSPRDVCRLPRPAGAALYARSPAGRAPSPVIEIYYSEIRSKTVKIPAAYGLAFLVAGFLGIIQVMIAFTGGVVSNPEVSVNIVIAGVIANSLLAFGFPGFHALQADRGGYLSLLVSAILAAGSIAGCLLLWLREAALSRLRTVAIKISGRPNG